MRTRSLSRLTRFSLFDEEACLQQAYEAMLKSPLGFMFSHEVRARSQPSHRIAIIDFARSRIKKKHAALLTVFDRLRRKRNLALYYDMGFVSHHDAEQALRSCSKVSECHPGRYRGAKALAENGVAHMCQERNRRYLLEPLDMALTASPCRSTFTV